MPMRYGRIHIELLPCAVQGLQVTGPDRWPLLEPAFPVGPPEDLADELLGFDGPMQRQHGGDHLVFSDQPSSQRRGQAGHMHVAVRSVVQISQARVACAGIRDKRLQALQGRVARQRKRELVERKSVGDQEKFPAELLR